MSYVDDILSCVSNVLSGLAVVFVFLNRLCLKFSLELFLESANFLPFKVVDALVYS